jgi:RimJ/RimL family protein N-acetyltransferase
LRPPIIQDAQAIKNLISYDLARWLTRMPWPYQLSDATDWLAALKWGEGSYIRAITLHGKIIGMIGLEDELGYWLAPEFWGKGYASEAAHAVLTEYFKNPDALPISSGYHLGNDRSANVLVKMGFSPNGCEMRPSLAQNRDLELQKMLLTPEQWHALNPVTITAGKNSLSPITIADFDALYGIFGNKDVAWQLGRWPHPLAPELLRKRIISMQWRGACGATFKITNAQGQTIGIIGFHSD